MKSLSPIVLLFIALVQLVCAVKNVDSLPNFGHETFDAPVSLERDVDDSDDDNLISRREPDVMGQTNGATYQIDDEDQRQQLLAAGAAVDDDELVAMARRVSPLVEMAQEQQQEDVGAPSYENLLAWPQAPRKEIYLLEDKDYPKSLFEDYSGKVGQVSGITTLPGGDVAIFHRAERGWTNETFNATTKVVANNPTAQDNLIKNNTIMIIDGENGGSVTSFGANLFYLPHSIVSDNLGNLWVSDVGRHQVMRLPTSMMQLASAADRDNHSAPRLRQKTTTTKHPFPGNLSRIWPDIILGEAFVPGNDRAHFCQPSELATDSQGRLLFVADGYCNKRVVVFTNQGRYLTTFGAEANMNIVHSLALLEEKNLICVADRENARILCYKAGLDGNLNQIGKLVVSIKYPLGRVFAITSVGPEHLFVSSNQMGTKRYDLAILNPFSKELKLVWTSSDLLEPHSLAHTHDGQYAYAADLSREAYKKVFKFNIIQLNKQNQLGPLAI